MRNTANTAWEVEIEALLGNSWNVPSGNRLDVEVSDDGAYHATEVRPDLLVVRRLDGTIRVGGDLSPNGYTVSSAEEPDLRLPQIALYEALRGDWSQKMFDAEAKEGGRAEFFLMREGDYPELFPSLQTYRSNVGSNASEEMKDVYQALEHVLFNKGYLVSRKDKEGQATEIWAHPRRFY